MFSCLSTNTRNFVHGPGRVQKVWIFQHHLVSIKAVNTYTYVEDQIFESKFILDKPCHVNRFGSGYGTCKVTIIIRLSEEILKAGLTLQFVTFIIITDGGNIPVAIIEKLIRAEHANVE